MLTSYTAQTVQNLHIIVLYDWLYCSAILLLRIVTPRWIVPTGGSLIV